jgi:hypothetical protein
MLTALGDDIGTALAGGGLATVGCCGIPLGLILLIIGLVMAGPQSQPQMMMGSAMPMNQMGATAVNMQMPAQTIQPPLSGDATGSVVPDMAAAYANQFSQPPTE